MKLINKKVTGLLSLLLFSTTAFGEINLNSMSGEYISYYGLISKKTVNLKFTALKRKNTSGSIVVTFSDFPDLGTCRGEVTQTASEYENSIRLDDYNGLKCSGLSGQNYDWVTFQYTMQIDAILGLSYIGDVLLKHPEKKTPLIFKKTLTSREK